MNGKSKPQLETIKKEPNRFFIITFEGRSALTRQSITGNLAIGTPDNLYINHGVAKSLIMKNAKCINPAIINIIEVSKKDHDEFVRKSY